MTVRDEASAGRLLDDYLARIGRGEPGALAATAVRTGSVGARHLLARAAAGPSATLDDLLAAARSGDRAFFAARRRRIVARAVADLARVIALQNRYPSDLDDALALYDALRVWRVPRVDQGLHAQLAYLTGRGDRAVALLRAYPLVPFDVRSGVRLDVANPFVTDRPEAPWWRAFSRLLPPADLALDDAVDRAPIDRLSAAAAPTGGGPTISVVVTAYRPDRGLLTAVRSLLGQSWPDIEVIVVDDASPPEHAVVLDACENLDSRVRVIRLAVNGGTYLARNVGLDAATGEFVTFQDSDDWSHPLRLQRQARPLVRHDGLVATTSEGIPVTDRLVLTRLGHLRHARLNPSSLMIRRAVVLGRVGYFDEVRRGADSELIERLRAAFGAAAVHHLKGDPLALIRLSPGSLSRGEVRAGWLHPARAAYLTGYRVWHKRIAAGEVDPYRPRRATGRPFAAPTHMLGGKGGPRRYDVVFVADWAGFDRTCEAALSEIRSLVGRGVRVAVAHLQDYRALARRRTGPHRLVQDLVNDGTVEYLYLADEATAALIVVRQPAVLQFAAGTPSGLRAPRALLVADEPPADYPPLGCDRVAREIFGAEPVWGPRDAAVRQALPAAVTVTAFHLPGVIEPVQAEPRRGRGDRPVVGVDLAPGPGPQSDLAAYLSSGRADVRMRREPGAQVADLPPDCLIYEPDDLGRRDFAGQLDFYLHFPPTGPDAGRTRPALEALAAGCVVVAPHRLSAAYGAAAVFGTAGEVPAIVDRYHGDPDRYGEQSGRARAAVAPYHPDGYAAAIQALVGTAGPSLASIHRHGWCRIRVDRFDVG